MYKEKGKLTYRVNDFFCGAGGISVGFRNAGFNVIWACDFDKYAVETYRKNVGDYVVQVDVRKLMCIDIPTAEVWAFGFPCQDLSVAGVKRGFCFKCSDCGKEFALDNTKYADDVKCPKCKGTNHTAMSRSGMLFEIMRLLDETQESRPEDMPKVLMAENVKGLKPYIPVLEQEFQKRGYTFHVQLFNSKYWDVPQNRERYYIVGVRQKTETFTFPKEQHENIPKLSTVLDKNVDEKYYISDDRAWIIIEQALEKLDKLGKVHATITPDRLNKRQNGPRSKPEEVEMFTLTAQDIHGIIVLQMIDHLDIKESNTIKRVHRSERVTDAYDVWKEVKISNLKRYYVRKLTPTEYGRLQAFPMQKWEQVVSDSQAYKQFGNAVTITVVTAVAQSIKTALDVGTN